MPQYLSPGVYIEELVGPHPIQGVSTSTTGMVGVTVRGPTDGKPKLVTNFNEYQVTFGGFVPIPGADVVRQWGSATNLEGGAWWTLPLAVKGFFDNGGQQLYVKRVFSGGANGATAASGFPVGGLVTEVTKDAAVGDSTLVLRNLLGIQNQIKLKLVRGDTGQYADQPTVHSYDSKLGTVTLEQPLAHEVRVGRGDVVEISTPLSGAAAADPANATAVFQAKALGAWGNDLQTQIRPMVGASMSILPDPGTGGLAITALHNDVAVDIAQVVVPVAAQTFDASIDTQQVVIAGRRFQASAPQVDQPSAGLLTFTISPENPQDQLHHPAWKSGLAVQRLRQANPGPGNQLVVNGAQNLYKDAIVELDNGTQKERTTVASFSGSVVTFNTALAHKYVETDWLRVIEAEVRLRYQPTINGSPVGQPVEEDFTNLRIADAGTSLAGDPNSLWIAVSNQSQLVTLEPGIAFSTDLMQFPTASPHGGWLKLTSGDDKLGALSVEDFVGIDGGSGHRTGIQALEDIDEIAICAVPGMWSQTVQSALIEHCTLLKDRFAILDPPDGEDIDGIGAFRQVLNTEYAALYYPWCITVDPSTSQNVHVPPSGHMAGIYAATDIDRGVHKAPANVVIQGINLVGGLAADVTKREQDVLNPVGINALRFFPGRGELVWGARTLSSDTDWKYINVRRLFIYVEKSIFNGTQWVVFEPNNDQLWALVRQSITAFLTTVWQSGALAGTTQDQAFFVQCDRTTMTQDDLDNGRLICIIGLAPVFPAEFVIFRFEQKTAISQQS
jgi:Bacteriophage tail sheath protein